MSKISEKKTFCLKIHIFHYLKRVGESGGIIEIPSREFFPQAKRALSKIVTNFTKKFDYFLMHIYNGKILLLSFLR